MRTSVSTDQTDNRVKIQAEGIQSHRPKTQVRNLSIKVGAKPSEGCDNEPHFDIVHASCTAGTTPVFLDQDVDRRASRVSDRPTNDPRESVGHEPYFP